MVDGSIADDESAGEAGDDGEVKRAKVALLR